MTPGRSRVWALYAMELRTLVRDRRTVVLSIVLPLLVMPVMLFGSRWTEVRRQRALETRESTYAVTGLRAQEARSLVEAAQGHRASGDEPGPPLQLRERQVEDPAAALSDGLLDFYLEGRNYSEAEAAAKTAREARRARSPAADANESAATTDGRPASRARMEGDILDLDDPAATPAADLLTIGIVYRGDRDESRMAARRLADRLRSLRRNQRHVVLATQGFPLAPVAVAALEVTSLAREEQVAGLALGRLMTLLLLFFLFSGGAVVAQDALAGEKERGTLETLLTTAIGRNEIVTAKVLLVFTVAVGITLIQVANLLVYVGFGLIPTSRHLTAAITPGLAAGLFVFLLPLAALVSGVLVLVSGHARSYREAQLYFLPLLLVGAVPALAASLPEISLRSAVVVMPIANISVGVKEMLVGRIDWPMLAVAWVATATAAAWAMALATKALSTERLILPSTGDAGARPGPPNVRPAHAATWFAVMWAVVLVVTLNVGEALGIRGQLFVNLVIVFLGGSLLFIRRYRLDAREVLSLRRPHPAVWIAVAIGAPAALGSGMAVFRISQAFFPVPRAMLESFSQYLAPEAIPFWQLLPWLTLLPGVCEEIAFRGVLLHALRRRYAPVAAALLVGLAFGLFHFSLFRMLPTAYLGIILAAVTILTGSIYPAMAWHALNNLIGLSMGRFFEKTDALPPLSYAAAVVLLGVSFWILWRTRVRPAPGRTGKH